MLMAAFIFCDKMFLFVLTVARSSKNRQDSESQSEDESSATSGKVETSVKTKHGYVPRRINPERKCKKGKLSVTKLKYLASCSKNMYVRKKIRRKFFYLFSRELNFAKMKRAYFTDLVFALWQKNTFKTKKKYNKKR